MTSTKQEVIHDDGRLYIDTPGLKDIDPEKNKAYAKEIEKTLKASLNSKLIFVAKLDSGRVRMDDFATIKVVCNAIDINPLEYGIIFNQISGKVIKKNGPTKEALEAKVWHKIQQSNKLDKKPSLVLILEEDEDLKDEDNACMKEGKEKDRLLGFIKNLKANNIHESQVKPIDVRSIEEVQEDLQKEYERLLKDKQDDGCCSIQ